MEKKAKIKKIIRISIPICILLAALFTFGVLWFKASVVVKECNKDTIKDNFTQSVNPAYETGYNSYGFRVFRHKKRALKQFQKDYAAGLEYMTRVRGLPEFSDNYKVLQKYELQCRMIGSNVQENIDNREEVQEQLSEIATFAYLYMNGKWQNYDEIPFISFVFEVLF